MDYLKMIEEVKKEIAEVDQTLRNLDIKRYVLMRKQYELEKRREKEINDFAKEAFELYTKKGTPQKIKVKEVTKNEKVIESVNPASDSCCGDCSKCSCKTKDVSEEDAVDNVAELAEFLSECLGCDIEVISEIKGEDGDSIICCCADLDFGFCD